MTEETLTTAIRFEIKSAEFYSDMAARVSNPRGKRRLQKMSREEDGHRQILERRFRTLFSKDYTPVSGVDADQRFQFRSTDVFDQAEALEVVSVAIDAERRSIDFYVKHLETAEDGEDRSLLQSLVKFERDHYKKLQREYGRLNKRFDWTS